jgi:beta-glucoside operon transcriptional antiterminator
VPLTEDEVTYLTLHVARMADDLRLQDAGVSPSSTTED